MMPYKALGKAGLLVLIAGHAVSIHAEDRNLELMFGGKAGYYQTSGNLFADKDLQGWGFTLKLMPEDFGKKSGDLRWFESWGWMLSLDLDSISGKSQSNYASLSTTSAEIDLTWTAFSAYACAFTHSPLPLCIGLPITNALYLEQEIAGQAFSSFSMGPSSTAVFLNLTAQHRPWNFGVQASTSYWNPTFAGVRTHFNLNQAQAFAGYVF
jgi:hypothetical protein